MAIDVDRVHEERVSAVMKAWGEDDQVLDPAKLFVSEMVVETIGSTNKVLLGSYDYHKIVASIPFSNSTYVTVCPVCVRKAEFANFQKLVGSRLVIPVLIADYKHYPDAPL